MILDTMVIESTKIPDLAMVEEYPLNPSRRAYWQMKDTATESGRDVLEVSSWRDLETSSEVVAVRSEGLVFWGNSG